MVRWDPELRLHLHPDLTCYPHEGVGPPHVTSR